MLRQQLQTWKLLRKSKGRLVLSPAGRKMHDGGRPLWDFVATAVAFPADEATALVTRIAVHWLLEGSTPSWDERQRIIADTLNRGRLPGGQREAGAAGRRPGALCGRAAGRWTACS